MTALTRLVWLAQAASKLLGSIQAQKDWSAVEKEAAELRKKLEDEELWTRDAQAAIEIQKRLAKLEGDLEKLKNFTERWDEARSMMDLAKEENDASLIADLVSDMEELEADLRSYFVRSLMTGADDQYGCFIELRAGAGGVESCDWVSMLSRMYQRWAQMQGFDVKVVEEVHGEVAGLKSATIQVSGDYAYGWSKTESGTHRFVRISPFSSVGKRHTSFVSVQVVSVAPESSISNAKQIEISPNDLKVEVMRSQGAGGQHVNKTESACQTERSQIQNRATAMQLLRAKLFQRELDEQARLKSDHYASIGDAGWGSQIRSYVLHPYHMVKDSRTGRQTNNVDAVLDGEIQEFMEAALLQAHQGGANGSAQRSNDDDF
nr:hypothetical protein HK105_007880 [Polyrhizophydium stewartii]